MTDRQTGRTRAGSLAESLAQARSRLAEAGVPSPAADAELLAAHVLGVTRGQLCTLSLRGDLLDEKSSLALDDLVEQRALRIPLQHLTGLAAFRGLQLRVGPGVFVPRPETEVTAGLAIEEARRPADPGADRALVVDLCTGSGAIALAVAAEVPRADVVALELDEQALAWADLNIRADLKTRSEQRTRSGQRPRVELRSGDVADCTATVLSDLVGRVDVVVSNPPYIPSHAVPVDPEVRRHDPPRALYGGGEDGLATPRAVVRAAAELLRPGGLLVMEHGDEQGPATRALTVVRTAAPTGQPIWEQAGTRQDLTGRDRVLVVRRHGISTQVGDSSA
ncbi:MAG: release factor glutamine methyltransferase [Actinomycetota bacterium]|nr:release factor glutamine methyltransferase [Actinomycetota bacterium]